MRKADWVRARRQKPRNEGVQKKRVVALVTGKIDVLIADM
jgi:hypothetical protein